MTVYTKSAKPKTVTIPVDKEETDRLFDNWILLADERDCFIIDDPDDDGTEDYILLGYYPEDGLFAESDKPETDTDETTKQQTLMQQGSKPQSSHTTATKPKTSYNN